MIKSLQDLEQMRQAYRLAMSVREGHPENNTQTHVLVCSGTACTSSAGQEVHSELLLQMAENKLTQRVKVIKTGCFGFCQKGPVVLVQPGNILYCQVQKEDVAELVHQQLMNGAVVERLLFQEPGTGIKRHKMNEINFFQYQQRLLLRNCGLIDPEDINEYIAQTGYFALAKVLRLSPGDAIEEVINSGLRGRGGGGFPTGRKWEIAASYSNKPKYIICNADEGDPGAFMDRSILEGDPHAVLEGLTIGAYAIGAEQGYIYVRAEYPIALRRLEIAIEQSRAQGLLGKHIMETGFSFDIDIKLGAGAFVCGEETALLRSAMGERGEPRPRPPYPAQTGLWGKPTVINNVETLANIPLLFNQGWEWYSRQGSALNSGTKVFSLAGKINNTGLIEVPMGSTLRSVIYDIGGGVPDGRSLKAVQTGGPSGGCIPAAYLNQPLEYDSLKEIGSTMGSGGLIVMDDTDCMVDIARFYMEFACDESCGRCTACRIGTKRLLEILQRITRGTGDMTDLILLEELANDVRNASLCGLGQTAPNPVLSTLRYFKDEYIAHVIEKRCPARVCKALSGYQIIPEKCIACGICVKTCGVNAISGEKKKSPYILDRDKCMRCGACLTACPKGAIIREGSLDKGMGLTEEVRNNELRDGTYTDA